MIFLGRRYWPEKLNGDWKQCLDVDISAESLSLQDRSVVEIVSNSKVRGKGREGGGMKGEPEGEREGRVALADIRYK